MTCILLVPKCNSTLCFCAAYNAHSYITLILLSPNPAHYKQQPTVVVVVVVVVTVVVQWSGQA